MKFLIFLVALSLTGISYGQFLTVKVDTIEIIEVPTSILAQVDICENCLLTIPISYNMETVAHQEILGRFRDGGRERDGGRFRKFLDRLFGGRRDSKKSKSCGS